MVDKQHGVMNYGNINNSGAFSNPLKRIGGGACRKGRASSGIGAGPFQLFIGRAITLVKLGEGDGSASGAAE